MKEVCGDFIFIFGFVFGFLVQLVFWKFQLILYCLLVLICFYFSLLYSFNVEYTRQIVVRRYFFWKFLYYNRIQFFIITLCFFFLLASIVVGCRCQVVLQKCFNRYIRGKWGGFRFILEVFLVCFFFQISRLNIINRFQQIYLYFILQEFKMIILKEIIVVFFIVVLNFKIFV